LIRKIFKSKFLSVLLILTLLLPFSATTLVMAAGPYPYTSGDPKVSDALDYLSLQQGSDGSIGSFLDSAWVVMAIAATGEDPDSWKDNPANPSIVEYLATNAGSASSTNDYSRMILAIVAADEDLTSFGGRNFLALLQAEYDGDQIGSDSLLNDDFWGVMALVAAGEDPSSDAIQDSMAFIIANRNATDGGWGNTTTGDSDVDDTAAAIMALIAAGENPSSVVITEALAYIESMQQDDGGFPSFFGPTNAETDSWAIGAIEAAGEDPTDTRWTSEGGNTAVDHLLSLQQDNGQFYFQDGVPGAWPSQTTAKAIIALLGKYYPVAILPPQEGVTIDIRIEGESNTVWSGSVTVTESTIIDDEGGEHYFGQPTALGALDEASQAGGFSYTVHDFGWSLAITDIDGAGDWANGPWWMFIVDGTSAGVGADAFILNETSPPNPPHDEILFALSNTFAEIPLKVEVDKTEPDVGEAFTVTVTEYDDGTGTWSPVDNATVYADQNYTTGQDGTVAITINSNMTVKVYAEKSGYIRSNRVSVVVGEGSAQPEESENVSLTADIIPAISFSVSPDSINFGELGPRDTSEPVDFELTNDGAWELFITAMVTDNAQNLYVNGLKLNDEKWDEFKTTISRDRSKDFEATLTVPETYTLTGSQNGTLIFWASEAP
jgi:hypothetical protein